MGEGLTRRAFLAGIGAGLSSSAWADAPAHSLRPVPRPADFAPVAAPPAGALVEAARLGAARVGFVVADAHSGQVLETMNPLLRQPPASVMKIVTSLYGLDRLGAGHRFRTRLIAGGPVRGGRLEGDLILVGGGDPTLDTDRLGEMARELKAAGIHEVTGEFRVHAAALPYVRAIDAGQPEHMGFNPAISGLNLNYNRVHFEWKRAQDGYQVSMDARARRFRPEVRSARMQVVNRDMPVYTYSEEGALDRWTVARGALGREGSRWLPVRHPEHYAAEVFQTLARSHGIVLGPARVTDRHPRGTVLVEAASDPLRDVLRGMLRYSNNLTAETVGLASSRAGGARPDNLRESAGEMADWLGSAYGAGRARFVDHSGLGDASRISASELVRTLVGVGPEGALRPILKEYALREAPETGLRAKTGTLHFVSALAGYARSPGGRDLAFAITCADTDRRAGLSRAELERPRGARSWSRRARNLQFQLVRRWSEIFGA